MRAKKRHNMFRQKTHLVLIILIHPYTYMYLSVCAIGVKQACVSALRQCLQYKFHNVLHAIIHHFLGAQDPL